MNLFEALEAMEQGKKVKCPHFQPGEYYKKDGDRYVDEMDCVVSNFTTNASYEIYERPIIKYVIMYDESAPLNAITLVGKKQTITRFFKEGGVKDAPEILS